MKKYMQFYDWVLKFRNVGGPRADLAIDLANDDDFPKSVDTLEDAESYLMGRLAGDRDIQALRGMWRAYEMALAKYHERRRV